MEALAGPFHSARGCRIPRCRDGRDACAKARRNWSSRHDHKPSARRRGRRLALGARRFISLGKVLAFERSEVEASPPRTSSPPPWPTPARSARVSPRPCRSRTRRSANVIGIEAQSHRLWREPHGRCDPNRARCRPPTERSPGASEGNGTEAPYSPNGESIDGSVRNAFARPVSATELARGWIIVDGKGP
jgi:hypothetical protein